MAVNRKPRREQGVGESNASLADEARLRSLAFSEMNPFDWNLNEYLGWYVDEEGDQIDSRAYFEDNLYSSIGSDDWRHDQNVEAWVDEIERGIYQREDELWALQDEFEISDLVESIRPRNTKHVKVHVGSEKSNSEELWTESKITKLNSADNKAYKVISYLTGSPVPRVLDPAKVLDIYLRNANPSIRSSSNLAERVGALITNTLIEIRKDYIEFVVESKRRETMEIAEIIGKYNPRVHDYISWKRVAEADSKPLEEEAEQLTLPEMNGKKGYVNRPGYRGNRKPQQVSFQIKPVPPELQGRETISVPEIMTFVTDSIGLPVMQRPQGYGKK